MRTASTFRQMAAAGLIAGLLGSAAGVHLVRPARADALPAGQDAAAVSGLPAAIQAALGPAVPADGVARSDVEAMAQVYAARGWQPIWSGQDSADERGRLVDARLAAADADGLRPADYGVEQVRKLEGKGDGEAAARRELLRSAGLLRYARDLHSGRLHSTENGFDISLDTLPFDPGAMLAAAASVPDLGALLDALAPQSPAYARLKTLLASLTVHAPTHWTNVPDVGKLEPGAASPAIPALRRRLKEAGDFKGDLASPLYDAPLVEAVKRFQARHGLHDDGIIGTMTYAAFNDMPVDRRRQVEVNMERLRHLDPDESAEYFFVNVPDYRLQLLEPGDRPGETRVAYEQHVVVGTEKDQTPSFSAVMSYIELNPNWHVPKSIAVREMLPKIRMDPGYLERNSYLLLSGGEPVNPWLINWNGITAQNFPFRIRQTPGDQNALGQMKFMFPNRYNVYIHDTPSKALFNRSRRSFSHGCIRLMKPMELADLLLGRQGWDETRVRGVLDAGKTRVVTLKDAIPVHIAYMTAWVDDKGRAQFRDDIYHLDGGLADRLDAARPPLLELPAAAREAHTQAQSPT